MVAVRGTLSLSEWVTNLRYNQVLVTDPTSVLAPFLGQQIHYGYSLVFTQLYPQIKADVTADSPERILLTGHSLGGGIATLVAYALSKDFPNTPVDAGLFAPPSVGNTAFAYDFNRRVNARRVAFTAYTTGPDSKYGSFGDPVPQLLCPSHGQCFFKSPELVSTKTSASSSQNYVTYEAVAGNVLFDWRSMPFPNPAYGLASHTIQQTYRAVDTLGGIVATHICSYPCFLSTAVNVTLDRCLFQQNVPGSTIPSSVQLYGLCKPPPPKEINGNLFAVDQVYYGN